MKTSKNSKNYKVRCTGYNQNWEHRFTEGKVYEVKDNTITSDCGHTYNMPFFNPDFTIIDWLKPWYKFEVVEEPKYKVGDHVIIEESNIEESFKFAGRTGVITATDGNNPKYRYLIKVDGEDHFFGIYCAVKGYVTENEKIVITHDGKTTTATMYKGDMKHVGTARCCPEDTFDFAYGAKLAMKRMMDEVEKWDKARADEESGWRVVNRHVKKGDYIRLKFDYFTFNKKGDVLKVSDVMREVARVCDKDHPRDTEMHGKSNHMWNYPLECYEVVEKIKEPKFTKYEEGQFVRVVKKETHHFPLGQIVKVVEHKTGFFDKEGIIMCEGFCEDVNMISIQCVLPEEIAPLD